MTNLNNVETKIVEELKANNFEVRIDDCEEGLLLSLTKYNTVTDLKIEIENDKIFVSYIEDEEFKTEKTRNLDSTFKFISCLVQ